jgi:hypothetical protein
MQEYSPEINHGKRRRERGRETKQKKTKPKLGVVDMTFRQILDKI